MKKNNYFYEQVYKAYKDYYIDKEVIGENGIHIGSVVDYKHINGKEIIEVEEKESGNITFIEVNDILLWLIANSVAYSL